MSRQDDGAVIVIVASMPMLAYRLFRSYVSVNYQGQESI